MEEIEKRKMSKGNKVMNAHLSDTIRGIVDYSVSNQIPREDVVGILSERGRYVLIFYKWKYGEGRERLNAYGRVWEDDSW